MKISKKEIYSCLRSICKDFGVSIAIKLKPLTSKNPTHALFDIKSNHIDIYIHQYDSLDSVFSVFFHELGHFKNKELGKFPLFHKYSLMEIPKNKRRYFLSTMLRAEQYTDKVGKELMKIYFPNLKFHQAYPKKFHKIDLKDMRGEYLEGFKFVDKLKKSQKL